MPIADFMRNLETAAKVLSSHMDRLRASQTTDDLDRLRASADIWLTPDLVKDFDPNDFAFLAPEERARLTSKVDQFRALASRASGRVPEVEELLQGVELLNEVLKPLGEYITNPEGAAILTTLWSIKEPTPDFVLGIDYTLDTDATGDPAVWIWVIVDDGVDPDSEPFKQFVRAFPRRVRKALQKVRSERIPYVRFRLRSEVKDAIAGGAHEPG